MGLQQFERRLERLVEGAFARAFRSGLQPVELGRRMAREMDLHRTVGVRGVIAPNHFVVAISPKDAERFEPFADTLVRELADAARDHARDRTYGFLGTVEVELVSDPGYAPGAFSVEAVVESGPGGGPVGALVTIDGHRIVVGDAPVTMGRHPTCDVVLADANVSRTHAEVRRDEQGFVVADLGSTNGTRLNGSGIGATHRVLADGDTITVGSTNIRFEAS